jgi:hypothetical protein
MPLKEQPLGPWMFLPQIVAIMGFDGLETVRCGVLLDATILSTRYSNYQNDNNLRQESKKMKSVGRFAASCECRIRRHRSHGAISSEYQDAPSTGGSQAAHQGTAGQAQEPGP